ncbi:MAG: 16S rRNA (uracil(1498)-N(3))-methyltransferase [Chitinophagales bacterium]
MEIFFSEKIFENQILLDEEESQHVIKVMRHRAGDELMVSDGKGKLFKTRLISDKGKECELEIIETLKEEAKPSPEIHIAIAPTKSIDRFEWFLEKATEMGVSEITPIISQRSERNKIKPDRVNKILISSMKQSLRLWLPKLNKMASLKDFLTSNFKLQTSNFIAHCQSQNLPPLKSLYQSQQSVVILVGPEGDFTRDEITLAEENGFVSVSLSEGRLRTETAGIVALHTIRLLNE